METTAIRRPERPAPNQDAIRGQVFTWLINDVVPQGRTLLDLGAGHCLFAMKARDAGYHVTAVDGRT